MFVSNMLIARTLGVEDFGIVSFLLGIVNVTIVAIDFGLSTAATKRIAEERGRGSNDIKLRTLIRSFQRTICLTGIAGAVACGCLVAFAPLSLLEGFKIADSWLLGLWVLVPTITKGIIAVFNGFEDMRFTLIGLLMLEPLKLAMLLVLLFSGAMTLQALFLIWGWTLLFALIIIVLIGRRFLDKRVGTIPSRPWRFSDITGRLHESIAYLMPFIGITIMPGLVALILGIVSTKTEIAWFAASASLASMSFLVLEPVAKTLLSAFTHRFARSGQAIAPSEGAQLLRMLSLVNVCVLLGYLLFGSLIIRWTYGGEFELAISVVMILAAVNFFESFRLGVDPLLFSINAVSMVSRIELVRYAIMLPFIIGLGWRYGALGAAIGALLASMVCNVIRMYVLQTRLDIPGMEFALRFVVLVGAVLAGWQLGVSPLGVASAALLLGRGLGLYRLADLQVVLRIVPSLLRFR